MSVGHHEFTSSSAFQHYLVVTAQANNPKPKRLMLLHGAGVGGELTWTFVAHYLKFWDEIYIPDLAGMGQSYFINTEHPELKDYSQQILELIEHLSLSLQDFDFAGYSFGGMVLEHLLKDKDFNGLVFLLEPAMLFSGECEQVLNKAKNYQQVADKLLLNGYDASAHRLFLDSVSPARQDATVDELTIKRLQDNPKGFAQSLQAITQALNDYCQYYTQWFSPWVGASFVGGLSWPAMHERHKQLAQQSDHWHFEVVANADHSLVFTRPRSIAKVMNLIAERQGYVSIK